jgi:hypothetical protein
MNDDRVVEIFRNSEWTRIPFKSLKIGDRIRMFEPNMTSVLLNGKEDMLVTKAPWEDHRGLMIGVENETI